MKWLPQLLVQLAEADAVLVRVHSSRGSVPREAGAWMAVFADAVLGTVGGGRLELDAIATARNHLLQLGAAPFTQRYALGPSLGQCCGGEVHLQFERITAQDSTAVLQRLQPSRTPVALFGGGHVGQALVDVLGNLPFAVEWIDSRDGIFPAVVPGNVHCEHSDPVQAAVAGLAPQSRVLIMSFSHAEDLDIVAACLARQRARSDLPYIGLIGSQTKWATFRHRLETRGFGADALAHITCPIGVPGIHDKRPEVIAVAVAAQLLQVQDPEPKAAA
ncbi:MAG: xanthine dehydrogenase accessory protein XdhC [Curvibacter sp. RIFCSPHIGHO2_12_FULL_63_18]|nr:MAG: xanthine dehydrogenase accessory protein XdhC [Curvibacter sp. GWA2_63_95]OGP04793.1 MAG: xanthine dehydrogenase accessory protein XdhC [Curvibacter sp. RIFCSPHIGHO2_12_FULL_63_18]